MNLSQRLSNSFYQVVATINEPHKVYLVRHRDSGRFYVKKILDIYSADVYNELKAHPILGIPQIIDSWEDNGQLIIIEEFISGVTLLDKIENDGSDTEGALTPEQIGHYMIGLCEILQRLHTHNPPLIHRDIKPSNIIITSYDNVILLDFNAARFYSGDPCRESDTQLLGTKGYAAPEQYGFGESSPQTDLFSVGRILQNCINSLPKDNSTAVSISNKHSASPAKTNDPHIFDNVIQKCTQLTPSKRYSSAEALKNALLNCLGESSRPDITGKVVNPYLPPGFRTLNLWKMIIASVVYIFIFFICFTLQVKGSSGLELLFEKVGIFALALMNIAMGSNYLGIQQYLLFHRSSSRALRIAGTLISMIASTVFLFMVMILFIGMFFAS